MHICHITTVHGAKDARIFHRMCSALAIRGHRVTLIARQSFVDDLVRSSSWNERIAASGRGSRVLLALKAALAERADVYHFHDPELITLGLALKALRPSAAVVYDVHEDYPSMMLDKYWIPKPMRPLLARTAKLANTMAARFLDGIVTADPGVESDFNQIASGRTLVYYNFPVPALFKVSMNGTPEVDLVYIGGMSARTGIFVLLDALLLLAQQGLRPTARLAGYTDGDEGRQVIEEVIRNKGLDRQVQLRRRMPHSEVPAWLRSGRVGLVMLQPIPKFMKNIPTKLFEYWACGRPVIASDLPPIRPFFADQKNGLLFNPTSAESLASAIQYMIEHPDDRERMGNFAQHQVASEWNNEREIDKLIAFYQAIARN